MELSGYPRGTVQVRTQTEITRHIDVSHCILIDASLVTIVLVVPL
jgi:hypothetical protein